MKSNLALIGFMGTGKSTVGKVLAEKLNKQYIELDSVIENKAGKSISKIFRDEGEIAFREMEIAAVKEISGKKNQVIACGGGIILNRINIERLRPDSIIVLLRASPSVILKRVSTTDDRPLLNSADKLKNIRNLLKQRGPLYKTASDFEIDTSRLSVESVVNEIIGKIEKDESFDIKK